MFWKKNKTPPNKAAPPQPANGSHKMTESERIRAEALANVRAAREALGEDTIQKIAEALKKKANSPMEQAKAKLAKVDTDRVLDEIKYMLDKNNNKT
jgi:hypothetical protein